MTRTRLHTGASHVVLILVCLLSFTSPMNGLVTSTHSTVYTDSPSYTRWYNALATRASGHPFPPKCTLTGIHGTCLESHLAPTNDEFIEWESYSIWLDCTQFDNVIACKELMN